MTAFGREMSYLWEFEDIYDSLISSEKLLFQIWVYDRVSEYAFGCISINLESIDSSIKPNLTLYTIPEDEKEFKRLLNIRNALINSESNQLTQQYFALELSDETVNKSILPELFGNLIRFSEFQITLMVLNLINLYVDTFNHKYIWATLWAVLNVWNYFRYAEELKEEDTFF
jgi:hypothetical protein